MMKGTLCLMPVLTSEICSTEDFRFGPRFVTMHNAYDRKLRKLALATAKELGVTVHEGVYIMCGGPQFETPAENRFLRTLGGDVVGKNTLICTWRL